MKKLLLAACVMVTLATKQDIDTLDSENGCGYNSCKNHHPKALNVHLIMHSHDDVAWTSTFSQYYSRNVESILSTVMDALWANRSRKFVYVETAFFWKWWQEQNDTTRIMVHVLVKRGQLQFAGGAWSMNDEATTHYQSIIDQFTYGLSKLESIFGPCARPRVGWQIDPFGHSREFASLLAAMGYDGLFIGRIDYQDLQARVGSKELEMLWRGDDHLGKSSEIFTSILKDGYLFESRSLGTLQNTLWRKYNGSKTNNVYIPIGGDFSMVQAEEDFKAVEASVEYLNKIFRESSPPINIFFSTPACYLKAVQDASPQLSVKTDDFFPYNSGGNTFWTGYYTSRPTIKYFEREANRILQMVKQIQVLAGLPFSNQAIIEKLRGALGLMQHHDSITGTEKQYVAEDLKRILDDAIESNMVVVRQGLGKYLHTQPILYFSRCSFNESSCKISEKSDRFVVSVYNSLGWSVTEAVRIPVKFGMYEVYAPHGIKKTHQLVDIPNAAKKIPTRHSRATHEIYFLVRLNPLSFKTFYIQRVNKKQDKITAIKRKHDGKERGRKKSANRVKRNQISPNESSWKTYYFENQYLRFRVNEQGELTYLVFKNGQEMQLSVQFYCYPDTPTASKHSGAYTFRSNVLENVFQNLTSAIDGPIVEEIRLSASEHVHNILRLYNGLNYLENEWIVGPINVSDRLSKEFIVKYVTDLMNNDEFYTDSNGRQMIKRTLNSRQSWKVALEDHVSGNYYPVTNRISIKGKKHKLSVLTDRPQGGSSLSAGEIELMLHRRLLHDDGFGVDEPLNEMVRGEGLVVRGKHRLFISDVDSKADRIEEKQQVLQFHLQPIVLVADASNIQLGEWLRLPDRGFTWGNSLPTGLHILTLEPWKENEALLRLENYLEPGDTQETTLTVNLKELFKSVTIRSYKETLLAGDVYVDEYQRFEWGGKTFNPKHRGELFVVRLTAKQIRTFIVYFY